MYYSAIKKHDIANGNGIRVSLFVSGCTTRCKGCFNPETWDFQYGQKFTEDTMQELLEALAPDHIEGLSILGGEPLHIRNIQGVGLIISKVRKAYPKKSIWVYTGYRWEHLPHRDAVRDIDVLVDGAFVERLKDLTLQFCGSSNQRIIDVQQTLKRGQVVLWRDRDRSVPVPDLMEYIRGTSV